MKRAMLALAILFFAPAAGRAILPGPIKDFYTHRPGDTTAVVFGTRDVKPDGLKKVELLAFRNADYLRQKDPARVVRVYADSAFPKELFARYSLVLLGTPGTLSLLDDWRNYFPFIRRGDRFSIFARKVYLGTELTLACIFPNPRANDRYVVLLLGNEPSGLPSLSDWSGDYDYYIAQRHTFPGGYLNRGKFQKLSNPWSQDLNEYDRTPGDTTELIDMVYPFGKVWYPYRWELDSLWKNPAEDKMKILTSVQDLVSFFERFLGMTMRSKMDFHLSDSYPKPAASDPMGRVFVRIRPDQIDSLTFDHWFQPLVQTVIPCWDAGLDWELFCHRYLYTEISLRPALRRASKELFADRGKRWLETLTFGDLTYLNFLRQVSDRGQIRKIGEAMDSVTAQGRKYSFKMQELVEVLVRLVKDSTLKKLATLPLRPSPYERQPIFNLGIENPGELFLKEEVMVGNLAAGSPAAATGLRKGDKIISVDGLPVERNRSRSYLAWLGKKKGETLKLVIERKGVRRTLVIPVG